MACHDDNPVARSSVRGRRQFALWDFAQEREPGAWRCTWGGLSLSYIRTGLSSSHIVGSIMCHERQLLWGVRSRDLNASVSLEPYDIV
jgi:hypothetical protein